MVTSYTTTQAIVQDVKTQPADESSLGHQKRQGIADGAREMRVNARGRLSPARGRRSGVQALYRRLRSSIIIPRTQDAGFRQNARSRIDCVMSLSNPRASKYLIHEQVGIEIRTLGGVQLFSQIRRRLPSSYPVPDRYIAHRTWYAVSKKTLLGDSLLATRTYS
jgi:hypothetical protein